MYNFDKLYLKILKENTDQNAVNYDEVEQRIKNFLNSEAPNLSMYSQNFVDSARKYNIDPYLMVSIALLETGRGTSDLFKNKNNIGGLYDSKNKRYMNFGTVPESIDLKAKTIQKLTNQGLDTIDKLATKYAPVGAANDPKGLNKNWPGSVKSFYSQITGTSADPTMIASNGQDQQTPTSTDNKDDDENPMLSSLKQNFSNIFKSGMDAETAKKALNTVLSTAWGAIKSAKQSS
jgi:hypothetical protein